MLSVFNASFAFLIFAILNYYLVGEQCGMGSLMIFLFIGSYCKNNEYIKDYYCYSQTI